MVLTMHNHAQPCTSNVAVRRDSQWQCVRQDMIVEIHAVDEAIGCGLRGRLSLVLMIGEILYRLRTRCRELPNWEAGVRNAVQWIVSWVVS